MIWYFWYWQNPCSFSLMDSDVTFSNLKTFSQSVNNICLRDASTSKNKIHLFRIFFLLITENIKSQDHHICVLYLFSRLGGVDQGFSASWESMLWEFWVLSREKPKIYSFSRFLHISPCWWLICLVRDKVSGRRVICVLVTWRKPVASCCSARSPPLSRSHWSRRSRAATCFLLQPIQRLFKNFHCFRLSVFLSTGEHNFTERISILYFSGGFFQTEKCWREMGIGKDDHVALERKSFIDFELGDASKEEAKEEDASLTEKKQIIDAIGSKDNPVENLSNWFGSERRSTSSLCEKSLTVLLLKCVVNLSNWQKRAWGVTILCVQPHEIRHFTIILIFISCLQRMKHVNGGSHATLNYE